MQECKKQTKKKIEKISSASRRRSKNETPSRGRRFFVRQTRLCTKAGVCAEGRRQQPSLKPSGGEHSQETEWRLPPGSRNSPSLKKSKAWKKKKKKGGNR